MKRVLLWLILLLLLPTGALGQSFGAARALLSTPNQPRPTVIDNGGLLFDFVFNAFVVSNPGVSVTEYPDFNSWFSALGGVATTGAKWMMGIDHYIHLTTANTVPQPCYTGSGAIKGICGEYFGATNFLLWSEDFTQSAWTKTGVSVSSSTTVTPKNDTSASTITEDSSNGLHALEQVTTGLGGNALTFTGGCFFAPGQGEARDAFVYADDNGGTPNGAYVIFPFQSGGAPEIFGVGGSPFSVLNTWPDTFGASPMLRLSMTYHSNTSGAIRFRCGLVNNGAISYQGDGASALTIWGAENKQHSGGALLQTETAPSSYTPSAGTNAVRPADQIKIPVPSFMASAHSYTIFNKVTLPRAGGGQGLWTSLNASDDSQYIYLSQTGSTQSYEWFAHLQSAGTGAFNIIEAPANVFDQSAAATFIADPGPSGLPFTGLNWYANSVGAVGTNSGTLALTVPVDHIYLGTSDPTSTLIGANVAIQQMMINPVSLSHEIAASFLYAGPPLNPDVIIPPNFLTQSVLCSMVPLPVGCSAGTYNVFRGPAGLPKDDTVPASQYAFYPLTVAYSGAVGDSQSSTFSTAKHGWLQWANACSALVTCITNTTTPRPNTIPGPSIRTSTNRIAGTYYTTVDKANAATLGASLYANNFPAHSTDAPFFGTCPAGLTWCGYMDPGDAQGMTQYLYTAAVSGKDTIFATPVQVCNPNGCVNYGVATDIVIFADSKFGAGSNPAIDWGTVCDCEFADHRTATVTLDLMTQMANIHHHAGYKFAVQPDPLLAQGLVAGFCGVGQTGNPAHPNCDIVNLPQIVTAVDSFDVITSYPVAGGLTYLQGLQQNYALLGTPNVDFPPSHVTISMLQGTWPGGTTPDQSQELHNFIVANGIGGNQTGQTQGQQCRWTLWKQQIIWGLLTSASCP